MLAETGPPFTNSLPTSPSNHQDTQIPQSEFQELLQATGEQRIPSNHAEFGLDCTNQSHDPIAGIPTQAVPDLNSQTPLKPKMGSWGDSILNIGEGDVRFLFQNVNGLSRLASTHEEFKANMIRLGSHLTAICESNVNWQNASFRDHWESTLQRRYSELQFSHSSCNEGNSKVIQRGGTSMVCNSRLSSRLISKGQDEHLGRWSWMRFHSSPGRELLIITAYQVSQFSPAGLGHETFYMQQWRKIREHNLKGDPRNNFWRDLTDFITSENDQQKVDVMVLFDANADYKDESLVEFTNRCQLMDLHDDATGGCLAPETYYRGTRRLDYILGSINVALSVSQVGILPYSDGLKYSDHRALFVDIKESVLFSGPGSDPTRRTARGLRASNTRQCEEYCKLFREKLESHNIFERCHKLRALGQQSEISAVKEEMEAIDKQITAAALKAERQVSHQSFGHPWSPKLVDAGRRVTFWRNCLRTVKSGLDPAKILTPSQIQDFGTLGKGLNKKFYQARLEDAWLELHLVQDNAHEIRQAYLEEEISKAAVTKGEQGRASKLRAILQAEYLSRMWPKLRRYAKGQVRSSLSRVELPIRDQEGEIIGWRSVSSKDSLFSELLKRNQAHFAQAKDTPFVNGIFGQELHPFEQNSFSETILDGSVDLGKFDANEAIKACIKELSYASGEDGSKSVDATITVEDFRSGFKIISEKLTSSPSGRHYGHYKAVLKDPQICSMYATMMSIPFELGLTLHRWEKVLQTMLEKTPGNPRIDKLRVIQIIEADLNMCLRIIFGRRLVQRAEQAGTIPSSQWGSRPNRSSTDCVFLKRLSYDGLIILKREGIVFNNDAKAAFDRMVPSIGGMALRRLGASKNAVEALLRTLENMKYQIRTALGISAETFSNIQDWVLGTLQGSGASPCLWLAITCVLLGALSKKSTGITFRNPRGTLQFQRVGEAYVDDTDLWTALERSTLEEMALEMEEVAQFWEQLLFTTGGALALEKCFFVAVQWSFEGDIYTLPKGLVGNVSISLSSGADYDQKEPIRQSATNVGSRVLGVFLAPDGNNAEDLKVMCAKGSSMARNVAHSKLSRSEVATAYEFMLRPSLRYPLCGTTFSKKECDTIDRSYLSMFLSKMGFNRNTKRLLLFGPPSLGAFGFTDTYTDQGISQLSLFIGHIRCKQEIGTLLQILMEHLQLVIGFGSPLFNYPFNRVSKFCDKTWLTSLWEYVNSIGAVIHLEDEWIILPQREGDIFLMEAFANPRLGLPPKTLKRLNSCRLFLQVLTLADICDGLGTSICVNSLRGQKHTDRKSRYEWANQAFPSPKAWSLWTLHLRKLFCKQKHGSTRLKTPLGQWLTHQPRHQEWKYSFDPCQKQLISRSRGSNFYCVHDQTSSPRMFHRTFTTRDCCPPDSIPVTIATSSNDFFQLTRLPTTANFPEQSNPANTAQTPLTPAAYIRNSHSFVRNSIGHSDITDNSLGALADELRKGSAIIASDGSAKNDNSFAPATQGWVVFGTSTKCRVSGHGTVPGGGENISSLRPELGGLCGALSAVDVILQTQPTPTQGKPIELNALLDNKAVIQRIKLWNVVNTSGVQNPEFDLLQAAKDITTKNSIKLSPRHIKSHQDRDQDYESLSWQARLNCDCDELAESVRSCHHCLRTAHQHYTLPPGHGATLSIGGKFITGHMSRQIKEASYRQETIEYISLNAKWSSPATFNRVDWKARTIAFKKIRRNNKITIFKLEFGLFATMNKRS